MLQFALLAVLVVLIAFVVRQARLVGRTAIAAHSRRTARLIAVVCIGMAMGVGVYFGEARKRTGGKEAFLNAQAQRFDRYVSKPHALVPEVLTGVVFAGAAVGGYELIAWVFYRVIRPAKKGDVSEPSEPQARS